MRSVLQNVLTIQLSEQNNVEKQKKEKLARSVHQRDQCDVLNSAAKRERDSKMVNTF